MTAFNDFFSNSVLWISFFSWFSAQTIKVILYVIKNKRFSFERVVGTGGMPSSHTATVCGLTTAVARCCGLDSPLFAVAFMLSAVVMYDATGIRRAAGEQAKVLNRLIREKNVSKEDYQKEAQKALKELLGHTPLEVFAGALLGIFLGLVCPVN